MSFQRVWRVHVTHIALTIACVVGVSEPARAQRLVLPPGKLDSAALQNPLQMIDFVYADDRPKAARLFSEMLARADDIAPDMVVQLRYLRAVAMSQQDTVIRWYRELVRLQGGEYATALPRVLLAVGEYSEALALARAWRPAPGTPPRALREDVEGMVARMRGDHRAALEAARAQRRYPGQAQSYAAVGRELAALAHLTPSVGAGHSASASGRAADRAVLEALLDSALAVMPRGFRVDPVLVFSGYGDALYDAGHEALAGTAWQRALALLDSTASRAADKGPIARDSVRVARGRLLFALGRYAEARPLLLAPSGRRDDREQWRKAWLAVTHIRLRDLSSARRLDAQLAADTTYALRGTTAMARAAIAEAMGAPTRGAGYILAHRDAIDLRTLLSQWMLRKTLADARVVRWTRGR